jgi:hypothetical protein
MFDNSSLWQYIQVCKKSAIEFTEIILSFDLGALLVMHIQKRVRVGTASNLRQ